MLADDVCLSRSHNQPQQPACGHQLAGWRSPGTTYGILERQCQRRCDQQHDKPVVSDLCLFSASYPPPAASRQTYNRTNMALLEHQPLIHSFQHGVWIRIWLHPGETIPQSRRKRRAHCPGICPQVHEPQPDAPRALHRPAYNCEQILWLLRR